MFIAFYILILNIITTFSANGFIRIENDAPVETYQDYRELPVKEDENNKGMSKLSGNDWNYLKKNSSSNLKGNIFDKMLSDEMLSLKEQFHKKDATYSHGVQITTKSNLRTPTLDVKQRWLQVTHNFKEGISDYSSKSDNQSKKNHVDMDVLPLKKMGSPTANIKLQKPKSKKKVLGLRSLAENPHILHVGVATTKKICTCFKGNPLSTCHKPAGDHQSGDHLCSRTTCTQTQSKSPTPFFSVSAVFITAQPYYVEHIPHEPGLAAIGIPPPMRPPNPFYPPAVVIGLPPNNPPPPPSDDSSEEEEEEEEEEKEEEEEEDSNIYYEDNKKNEDVGYNREQHLSESDNQLVEGIANDLNRQYDTATLKKCHCSATITRVSKLFLLILIYVIKLM